MEACLAVEKELDKVLTKFSQLDKSSSTQLQECLLEINKIKQELSSLPENSELSVAHSLLLSSSVKKIKDSIKTLSSSHKDLHSSVSKVGKAIDRNFVSDYSSIVPDENIPQESTTAVNHIICEHFFRQGMLDIAESLVNESGLEVEHAQREPFLELHGILESLKQHDLRPALLWVSMNKEKLRQRNSSLEFKLHKLYFIGLIQQGPEKQLEALLYARNFEPFSYVYTDEIKTLMGCLLYIKQGLQNSPYGHLLAPVLWLDIEDTFTRDACALLGLSVESPLSVVINAGCAALPPLLSIKQVMAQRQCQGVWNAKEELPVEIDLGKDSHFHSLFACPILRQQSTDSNPPVRLVCGHVISRDALNKLANGNKVKCPYCPVEHSPKEAKIILF